MNPWVILQLDWNIEHIENLTWLNLPKPLYIAIGGAIFLAICALIYLKEKPTAPGLAKGVMALLRLCALAICFLVLFQPIQRFERKYTKNAYVLVVIDQSRSMSYLDRYRNPTHYQSLQELTGIHPTKVLKKKKQLASRLDIVKSLLLDKDKAFLSHLRANNHLRLVAFSDTVESVVGDLKRSSTDDFQARENAISNLKPLGQFTQLGACLAAAKEDLRRNGHDIAAIILFTDGQSNAGDPSAIQAAKDLATSKIPLYIFGIGNPEPEKDVEIFHLEAPQKAKVGESIYFNFKLRARGYTQPLSLQAKLYHNGKQINEKTLHLSPSQILSAKFRYVISELTLQNPPVRPPYHKFEVRIQPLSDEWNLKNNQQTIYVQIQNKKLFILYVEGYPRWEYRYLKNELIRHQKTLKVQCILLTANPKDQAVSADVRPEEYIGSFPDSSIPFDPSRATLEEKKQGYLEKQKEEIFKKLQRYNVIIWGDVPYWELNAEGEKRYYFNKAQLAALRQFVEFGGGFIAIAGVKYFPHQYRETPLADILPIEIPKSSLNALPFEHTYTESFRPRLTPAGLKSKILNFHENDRKNKLLWESERGLPGFFWYYQAKKVKETAVVLAHHPYHKSRFGYAPIFVVHNYGNGRVMFSAVDSTWRWRAGVGSRYFYPFWREAIRYVSKGKIRNQRRKYVLKTDKTFYTQGKDNIYVYALIKSSKKKRKKVAQVQVFGPYPKSRWKQLRLAQNKKTPSQEQKRYRRTLLKAIKEKKSPSLQLSLASTFTDVEDQHFEGKFKAIEPGIYILQLGQPYLSSSGDLKGGALRSILVEKYDLEMANVQLNETLLKKMAKITKIGSQGGYWPIFHKTLFQKEKLPHYQTTYPGLISYRPDIQQKNLKLFTFETLPFRILPQQKQLTEPHSVRHIWQNPLWLIALITLLTLEWILRKIFRLM
ncbi:MAG: VWA domain-containing protein [Planctomycetota bacterium]|nr:MAG: VWA domain-containing protein [Planctomycetota bacterium]